jgi:hypothetical protein
VIDTQVPATCPLSTRNAFALLVNDTDAEMDHEKVKNMKTSELHSLLTPIQMLRRVQLPLNIRSQSYKNRKAHIAEGPKEVNLLQLILLLLIE